MIYLFKMVIFPVRYVKLPEAISAQEPWQTYVGPVNPVGIGALAARSSPLPPWWSDLGKGELIGEITTQIIGKYRVYHSVAYYWWINGILWWFSDS